MAMVGESGCERGNISSQLVLRFPQLRKFSSQAHVRVPKAAVLLLELRDPPIVEAKPLYQQRLERAALNAPPPIRIAPNDLREILLDLLREEAEHRLVSEVALRELLAPPLEAHTLDTE